MPLSLKKFLFLTTLFTILGSGAGGFAAWRWVAKAYPPEQRAALAFAVQSALLTKTGGGGVVLSNPGGGRVRADAAAMFYSHVPVVQQTIKTLTLSGGGGALTGLLLVFFWVWLRSERRDFHERGARMAPASAVGAQARKQACRAQIGSVPIPARIEPYHFLLSGGTGSGKSQAFFQLMAGSRARRHRAVVVDVGGEFLKRFWMPGDTILNPMDARSAAWSPLSEMREVWDADKISKSIVPDAPGNDAQWSHFSQVLISAVLRRLHEAGGGNNAELLRLLNAGGDELADLVEGLPAASLFDPGASRMLASVRGIVGTYLAPYSYLPAHAGEDAFSVRKWVEQEGDSWLFLTVRDDQLATLKPLIAAWVDIAISALLALDPSADRRVWFLLDEFASLGRIQSIEPLLTKARKQGGVGVLGLQAVPQFVEAYGPNTAKTLLSCLGTWLVLRAPDPETAEYMSKYFGDEEVRRLTTSSTSQTDGWIRGEVARNRSEQITNRRIVMASDLQSLPDLEGFLSLVGDFPSCRVAVPVSRLSPDKAEAFISRTRGQAGAPAPAPARASAQAPEPPAPQTMNETENANDPFKELGLF